MRKTGIAALAAALMLGGCATIMEGTSQPITVNVVPASGNCEITRQGQPIAVSTPEHRVVTVSKSQYDLDFKCSAPGFRTKEATLTSDLSAATVASFFLLDFGIVDASTGAWKKYPSQMTVILDPEPAVANPPHRTARGKPKA